MMRNRLFTLLISLFLAAISYAQKDLNTVEENVQEKVKNYASLMYKGQPLAYAELFAEDAIIAKDSLFGIDQIKNFISRWQIPPTDYSIKFYPLVQLDSSYVMSYKITEASGFATEQVEVWKHYDDELKISFANIVIIEPSSTTAGISKQRFILSTVVLGIFLFLLLIILKNARQWKVRE